MTYDRHPLRNSRIKLPLDLVTKMEELMGEENLRTLLSRLSKLYLNRSDEEFARINLCVVTLMTCRHKNMKAPTSEELCLTAVANGLEPPEPNPVKAKHRFVLWAVSLFEVEKLFPRRRHEEGDCN